MGDFVCQSLTMKVVAALLTIALHQAAADWSGSGEFSCYGHVSTDVTSPEGGDHLGEGTLNCNIIEWGGGPLGPEAIFFKPNGGAEFEIWAVSVWGCCLHLNMQSFSFRLSVRLPLFSL